MSVGLVFDWSIINFRYVFAFATFFLLHGWFITDQEKIYSYFVSPKGRKRKNKLILFFKKTFFLPSESLMFDPDPLNPGQAKKHWSILEKFQFGLFREDNSWFPHLRGIPRWIFHTLPIFLLLFDPLISFRIRQIVNLPDLDYYNRKRSGGFEWFWFDYFVVGFLVQTILIASV